MIKFIKAEKDSTIDEIYPLSNYGLNNVLFLRKERRDVNLNYNTRMLIKFNLNEIQKLLNSGKLTSPRYYLNLYSVYSYDIDFDTDIEIYPVSGSWENGTGINTGNVYLQEEEGVSWKFRNNINESNLSWSFNNLEQNVTYSYETNMGGGNWYDNLRSTHSISYYNNDVLDIRTDVTDIVNEWLTGSIENDGFIIKRSKEQESDYKNYKELGFFSKDSTTIYYPKLEVIEDDSTYATGSNNEFADVENKQYRIYSSNLKDEYRQNSKDKIIIYCNELYPDQTYESELTSSLKTKSLPSESYYEIKLVDNNETIIKKSEGTKINLNGNQNYFYIDFKNLNKHYNYKISYVVIADDSIEKYYTDNKIFTVK